MTHHFKVTVQTVTMQCVLMPKSPHGKHVLTGTLPSGECILETNVQALMWMKTETVHRRLQATAEDRLNRYLRVLRGR